MKCHLIDENIYIQGIGESELFTVINTLNRNEINITEKIVRYKRSARIVLN